jgi:hypothetical protein
MCEKLITRIRFKLRAQSLAASVMVRDIYLIAADVQDKSGSHQVPTYCTAIRTRGHSCLGKAVNRKPRLISCTRPCARHACVYIALSPHVVVCTPRQLVARWSAPQFYAWLQGRLLQRGRFQLGAGS